MQRKNYFQSKARGSREAPHEPHATCWLVGSSMEIVFKRCGGTRTRFRVFHTHTCVFEMGPHPQIIHAYQYTLRLRLSERWRCAIFRTWTRARSTCIKCELLRAQFHKGSRYAVLRLPPFFDRIKSTISKSWLVKKNEPENVIVLKFIVLKFQFASFFGVFFLGSVKTKPYKCDFLHINL